MKIKHQLNSVLVACFKCYFNGDKSEKFEMQCNEGCVNVTRNGVTVRNCWSKNDFQNEGCKMYDDEEICICFTELCNFGEPEIQKPLNSTSLISAIEPLTNSLQLPTNVSSPFISASSNLTEDTGKDNADE